MLQAHKDQQDQRVLQERLAHKVQQDQRVLQAQQELMAQPVSYTHLTLPTTPYV